MNIFERGGDGSKSSFMNVVGHETCKVDKLSKYRESCINLNDINGDFENILRNLDDDFSFDERSGLLCSDEVRMYYFMKFLGFTNLDESDEVIVEIEDSLGI